MLNAFTTLDATLDPVLAAHLAQKPRRHAREGDAEVRLRADLLHVGRRPASLAREHVELQQQHRLADPAQARVDKAALIAAAAQPLDQRLHVLQVRVATGEDRRLPPGARRVRVVAFVQRPLRFSNKGSIPVRNS
jgi:hypothetical protein